MRTTESKAVRRANEWRQAPTGTRHQQTHRHQDWAKAILARDDYTCQDCGQRGGKLHAHHEQSVMQRPDLALELDNGVTLCVPCHRVGRHGLAA